MLLTLGTFRCQQQGQHCSAKFDPVHATLVRLCSHLPRTQGDQLCVVESKVMLGDNAHSHSPGMYTRLVSHHQEG